MEGTKMIDFSRLLGIIPEEGQCTLTFKRGAEGKVIVSYKPTYKKQGDNELKPVILSGTVSELNEQFEEGIGRIVATHKKLADQWAANIAAIEKQTEEAKKKAALKKPGSSSGNQTDKAASAAKPGLPAPAKDATLDLFGGTSEPETEDTSEETEPAE